MAKKAKKQADKLDLELMFPGLIFALTGDAKDDESGFAAPTIQFTDGHD
jgi:hypothetical protein